MPTRHTVPYLTLNLGTDVATITRPQPRPAVAARGMGPRLAAAAAFSLRGREPDAPAFIRGIVVTVRVWRPNMLVIAVAALRTRTPANKPIRPAAVSSTPCPAGGRARVITERDVRRMSTGQYP